MITHRENKICIKFLLFQIMYKCFLQCWFKTQKILHLMVINCLLKTIEVNSKHVQFEK